MNPTYFKHQNVWIFFQNWFLKYLSKYAYETGRENPQVTQLAFTCPKSTMKTPEKSVKSIQSSEVYLEPNLPFFL